jgi:prevent-host-death family protein
VSTWQLQAAKARLSELLRAVRDEGPQVITVRGKEEYVVMRKADAPAAALGRPTPKTWDELYALAEGAGEHLVLPNREVDPAKTLDLGEDGAQWKDD